MILLTPFRTGLSAMAGLLSFGLSVQAFAQTVATTPVGAMTYNFPATTQITTTYISIPLTNPSIYTGVVASRTSNTITFSGTPFTAGELAVVGSPFFVHIASGPQAGRTLLVTANTVDTVTVDTTDNSSQTTALDTNGWALTVGNKIEIIVGDTLATLFGDNSSSNPLIFSGAASAFTADTVGFYNKSTLKFDVYYFNTTSGFWRLSNGVANVSSLVIYPEVAIQINRRSGRSASSLTLIGGVPAVAPLTKTTGAGLIAYTSSRYPVDITLSQLAISGWVKSNSAFTADTISIYNPATLKNDTYFQRLDNGQWRKSGDASTDQSSFVIASGTAIFILKRGVVANSASMLSSAIPYNL